MPEGSKVSDTNRSWGEGFATLRCFYASTHQSQIIRSLAELEKLTAHWGDNSSMLQETLRTAVAYPSFSSSKLQNGPCFDQTNFWHLENVEGKSTTYSLFCTPQTIPGEGLAGMALDRIKRKAFLISWHHINNYWLYVCFKYLKYFQTGDLNFSVLSTVFSPALNFYAVMRQISKTLNFCCASQSKGCC